MKFDMTGNNIKERALHVIKHKGVCHVSSMYVCCTKCGLLFYCREAVDKAGHSTNKRYKLILEFYVSIYGRDDDLLEHLI